jgi:threonine dehydratase
MRSHESRRRLSIGRIEAAVTSIDPVFLDTPQFESESLSAALGVRAVLKVETVNPIRSFKGRGASLYMSRVPPGTEVICASAGNFGQAMAYAGRGRGIAVTVYAAEQANPLKVERMRALGADVVLFGDDFDAARAEAQRVAEERGARLVVDSLDVETIEGAGTIGLELLRLERPLDVLLLPLGNGAMCNGVATVMKRRSPTTRVVAVAAAGASAMVESWRSGRLVEHERTDTIADGLATRSPIPEALADMKELIDDALLVEDGSMIIGMRLLHSHAGLVAEPSAAAGVAAILENPESFRGSDVGTIVCGGNVGEDQMRRWLGAG